jgi:glycosyltransferase involved in cell wall biosynthesis
MINQKNAGVARARWAGIAASRGEYIGFLDSDDEIMPRMISTLLYQMEKDKTKIGVCNSVMAVDNKEKLQYNYKNAILNNEDAINKIIIEENDGHLWNKIIHRDLFSYEMIAKTFDIVCAEDLLLVSYILSTKKEAVTIISKPYYRYYIRMDSASRSNTIRSVIDYLIVHKKVRHRLIQSGYSKINKRLPYFKLVHEYLPVWVQFENTLLKKERHSRIMKKAILNAIKKIGIRELLFSKAKLKVIVKYLLIKAGVFVFIFKIKYMIKKVLFENK